jgi:hypothetical protein
VGGSDQPPRQRCRGGFLLRSGVGSFAAAPCARSNASRLPRQFGHDEQSLMPVMPRHVVHTCDAGAGDASTTDLGAIDKVVVTDLARHHGHGVARWKVTA